MLQCTQVKSEVSLIQMIIVPKASDIGHCVSMLHDHVLVYLVSLFILNIYLKRGRGYSAYKEVYGFLTDMYDMLLLIV